MPSEHTLTTHHDPSSASSSHTNGCFIGSHLEEILRTFLGGNSDDVGRNLGMDKDVSERFVDEVLPAIGDCTDEESLRKVLTDFQDSDFIDYLPGYREFVSALTASGAPMVTRGLWQVAQALKGRPWPPRKIDAHIATAKEISDIVVVCEFAQQRINASLKDYRSQLQASSNSHLSDTPSGIDSIRAPECDTGIREEMEKALEGEFLDPEALKETMIKRCLETTIRNTLKAIWDTCVSAEALFAQSELFTEDDLTHLNVACEVLKPGLIDCFKQCGWLGSKDESARPVPDLSANQTNVTPASQLSFDPQLLAEIKTTLVSGTDPSHQLKKKIICHHLLTSLGTEFPVDHKVWQIPKCACEGCNEIPPTRDKQDYSRKRLRLT
ncbi:hypothetical protein DB88DRAFT_507091 [Papiliotrema laurentii]|uniref:Uncharacterized protein n=1 Tax=Papiliotrema laurentii TaxID=5418 RepID=A0AAD9FVE9_PAPLA|nr:hypothetical protein DB88DRAFT_507091 [Papiliotrema laurentii]